LREEKFHLSEEHFSEKPKKR
jgi:hypothetical protein